MTKRHNRAVSQVLVKWKGLDVSESTWEDFTVLVGKLRNDSFVGDTSS